MSEAGNSASSSFSMMMIVTAVVFVGFGVVGDAFPVFVSLSLSLLAISGLYLLLSARAQEAHQRYTCCIVQREREARKSPRHVHALSSVQEGRAESSSSSCVSFCGEKYKMIRDRNSKCPGRHPCTGYRERGAGGIFRSRSGPYLLRAVQSVLLLLCVPMHFSGSRENNGGAAADTE